MDWIRPYLISRARVAALRAAALTGGKPRPEQLIRALEPVLGDLLDAPWEMLATIAERTEAASSEAAWDREATRRAGLGTSTSGPGRGNTVDKSKKRKRK